MYLCARNGEISEESIRTATVVWIAVVGSKSSCGRNRRSRDAFRYLGVFLFVLEKAVEPLLVHFHFPLLRMGCGRSLR